MRLRQWYALRGPGYIRKRAAVLLERYGILPAKAVDRVESLVATLAEYGCAPTLPTPGRVVQRYPQLIRRLQDGGAEIAVHSHDHVDLSACPPTEARQQLMRAAQAFARHGIEGHGFRCPYLSCSDDLLDVLPKGMFDYSSNKAILWDVASSADANGVATTSDVLHRLYKPESALAAVCTPSTRSDIVEIPVCLPDDLELHDGFRLGPEGIAQAWCQVLNRTHRRGELFVLLFHPELGRLCAEPFVRVLREATRLQPPVWIARLRDISSWWREKSSFAVSTSDAPGGLQIAFACSERATILVKGLKPCGSGPAWDEAYHQLRTRTLTVPAEPRPFVGLPGSAPDRIVSFLQEQGYILDIGETAPLCGTYLNTETLAGLTSELQLIQTIEASPGPLVRYWRWPGGASSALSITGDLDALTLLDYASRLFAR